LVSLPCAALVPAHLLFLVRAQGLELCDRTKTFGNVCASWISSWIVTVSRFRFHVQFLSNCSGSKLVGSALSADVLSSPCGFSAEISVWLC
jgi:hypothetical protein